MDLADLWGERGEKVSLSRVIDGVLEVGTRREGKRYSLFKYRSLVFVPRKPIH